MSPGFNPNFEKNTNKNSENSNENEQQTDDQDRTSLFHEKDNTKTLFESPNQDQDSLDNKLGDKSNPSEVIAEHDEPERDIIAEIKYHLSFFEYVGESDQVINYINQEIIANESLNNSQKYELLQNVLQNLIEKNRLRVSKNKIKRQIFSLDSDNIDLYEVQNQVYNIENLYKRSNFKNKVLKKVVQDLNNYFFVLKDKVLQSGNIYNTKTSNGNTLYNNSLNSFNINESDLNFDGNNIDNGKNNNVKTELTDKELENIDDMDIDVEELDDDIMDQLIPLSFEQDNLDNVKNEGENNEPLVDKKSGKERMELHYNTYDQAGILNSQLLDIFNKKKQIPNFSFESGDMVLSLDDLKNVLAINSVLIEELFFFDKKDYINKSNKVQSDKDKDEDEDEDKKDAGDGQDLGLWFLFLQSLKNCSKNDLKEVLKFVILNSISENVFGGVYDQKLNKNIYFVLSINGSKYKLKKSYLLKMFILVYLITGLKINFFKLYIKNRAIFVLFDLFDRKNNKKQQFFLFDFRLRNKSNDYKIEVSDKNIVLR